MKYTNISTNTVMIPHIGEVKPNDIINIPDDMNVNSASLQPAQEVKAPQPLPNSDKK